MPAMPEMPPFPDFFARSVARIEESGAIRWIALRDTDHLLRRFGQAEVVRLLPERLPALRLRRAADEIWALLEGDVEFRWRDIRSDSPAQGTQHSLTCSQPTLVLAPAGVPFGLRALKGPALLLRLATHADDDLASQGDQVHPWEVEG
jgi:dTDP-4-dehydrorhamnose 3,5-epimerase